MSKKVLSLKAKLQVSMFYNLTVLIVDYPKILARLIIIALGDLLLLFRTLLLFCYCENSAFLPLNGKFFLARSYSDSTTFRHRFSLFAVGKQALTF